MIGKFKKRNIDNLSSEVSIGFPLISKTTIDGNRCVPGIDVETHCKITGFVACELLNFIQNDVKKTLFPKNSGLIAAIHDVGKASPCFQRMIYKNIDGFKCENQYSILKTANSCSAGRKNDGFHGAVSESAISYAAQMDDCFGGLLPKIEGMHHGFKPVTIKDEKSSVYGGEIWANYRADLLKSLKNIFGLLEDVVTDDTQAGVLGGFITVCDWIASGGEFAKLKLEHGKTDDELRKMACDAVKQAGFSTVNVVHDLSFEQIFGFYPRNIQKDFFKSVTEPGVYVLEAPMGLGKTEAALYAAYHMLDKRLASGIYFGLPTQLTSNKIYDRVKTFLSKIFNEDDKSIELRLLHSAAWLENKTFGEDGDAGKDWFDSSKRGLLAPFAVGTVDQALMAVMNVKHGLVRAFGLAGKVVILDEVHSYDSYTGTILNELVKTLRKNCCTVLILSATLTGAQKAKILKLDEKDCSCREYPLITSLGKQEQSLEIPCERQSGRQVKISVTDDYEKTIELVLEKIEKGEQILWIENTVSEAQETFKKFAARTNGWDVECGLIHSRFIKTARQDNEDYWVSLYGKDAGNKRQKCGRILVGTQVLEQSVDIDADFLVTKICPTDMLLQRMGRLYRHQKNDEKRPSSASCSAIILSPDYSAVLTKKDLFGMSAFVYSEYVLCRTLEVWKDKCQVSMPEDIRPLLEETYRDRDEIGRLKCLKDELKDKIDHLERMARLGLSNILHTVDDSFAQTRYSEIESVSVLLLKSYNRLTRTMVFYNGEKLNLPKSKGLSSDAKKRIAKTIMENCVVVSEKNAPPMGIKVKNIFSDFVYTGNDEDKSPFRVAIVNDSEYLYSLHNEKIETEGNRFLYNSNYGYQVVKE